METQQIDTHQKQSNAPINETSTTSSKPHQRTLNRKPANNQQQKWTNCQRQINITSKNNQRNNNNKTKTKSNNDKAISTSNQGNINDTINEKSTKHQQNNNE